MIKTVNLTADTEEKVTGLEYAHARVTNNTTGILYASKHSGIVAGGDDVLAIPAGTGDYVKNAGGTVYLLSSAGGSVQLEGDGASETSYRPFARAASGGGGGETTDSVARAAIEAHAGNTDIHTTAAEVAAMVSNPNLLINPDFAVNQRGQTEYTASGYTVDRWQITASSKLTPHDGYITFESTVDKATAPLYQKCENPAALSGKTVTLSFDCDLKTEGAWISVQAITNGSWSPSTPVHITDTGRNVKSTVINLPDNLTDLRVALVIHGTDSAPLAAVDIYGAKLEIGEVATPIVPADPATELAKCQRYYQLRSTGDIDPTDLRPTMRTITDIRQREDGKYEYIAEL